jgi:choline-sulfatase
MLTRRAFAAPALLGFAKPNKPNLLFLIADDHAGYVLGAQGNRLAQTPNLDRLASQGTRFANNYCNSPVCTPSRQSILTGLYPHAVGVTTLRTPLNEAKTTLADLLQASGYRTGVFGKMHFNSPGKDGMHGFATAMTEDRITRGWTQAVGPTQAPWRPFVDPARTWLNADKAPFPRPDAEMRSTWATQQAGRWLEDHAKQAEQPFALWLSIEEPHSPFRFPREDAQRFNPASFQVPTVGPEDAWQIPLIFAELSPQEKQGIIAAYYSSAAFLDRNIGRMLDKLRALNLEEDTLVVYMADHGYSLGQHGRFEKHCFYQPAMQVPLIFRWPGKIARNKTIQRPTESVDVTPTITQLLGIERFPQTHGRHLFEGAPREQIFSVYLENEEACLIEGRWKLIYTTGQRKRNDGYLTANPTPGRIVRLYDRKADPGEFKNLASAEPALALSLTKKLEARFQATHPEQGLTLDQYLRPRDA